MPDELFLSALIKVFIGCLDKKSNEALYGQ